MKQKHSMVLVLVLGSITWFYLSESVNLDSVFNFDQRSLIIYSLGEFVNGFISGSFSFFSTILFLTMVSLIFRSVQKSPRGWFPPKDFYQDGLIYVYGFCSCSADNQVWEHSYPPYLYMGWYIRSSGYTLARWCAFSFRLLRIIIRRKHLHGLMYYKKSELEESFLFSFSYSYFKLRQCKDQRLHSVTTLFSENRELYQEAFYFENDKESTPVLGFREQQVLETTHGISLDSLMAQMEFQEQDLQEQDVFLGPLSKSWSVFRKSVTSINMDIGSHQKGSRQNRSSILENEVTGLNSWWRVSSFFLEYVSFYLVYSFFCFKEVARMKTLKAKHSWGLHQQNTVVEGTEPNSLSSIAYSESGGYVSARLMSFFSWCFFLVEKKGWVQVISFMSFLDKEADKLWNSHFICLDRYFFHVPGGYQISYRRHSPCLSFSNHNFSYLERLEWSSWPHVTSKWTAYHKSECALTLSKRGTTFQMGQFPSINSSTCLWLWFCDYPSRSEINVYSQGMLQSKCATSHFFGDPYFKHLYFFLIRCEIIQCCQVVNFLSTHTQYKKRWSYLSNKCPVVLYTPIPNLAFNYKPNRSGFKFFSSVAHWKLFSKKNVHHYYFSGCSLYRYNPLTTVSLNSFVPHYSSCLSAYQRWPVWYRFCGSSWRHQSLKASELVQEWNIQQKTSSFLRKQGRAYPLTSQGTFSNAFFQTFVMNQLAFETLISSASSFLSHIREPISSGLDPYKSLVSFVNSASLPSSTSTCFTDSSLLQVKALQYSMATEDLITNRVGPHTEWLFSSYWYCCLLQHNHLMAWFSQGHLRRPLAHDDLGTSPSSPYSKVAFPGSYLMLSRVRLLWYNFLKYYECFKRSELFQGSLEEEEVNPTIDLLYSRSTAAGFLKRISFLVPDYSLWDVFKYSFKYRLLVLINIKLSEILRWCFYRHITIYSTYLFFWTFVSFAIHCLRLCSSVLVFSASQILFWLECFSHRIALREHRSHLELTSYLYHLLVGSLSKRKIVDGLLQTSLVQTSIGTFYRSCFFYTTIKIIHFLWERNKTKLRKLFEKTWGSRSPKHQACFRLRKHLVSWRRGFSHHVKRLSVDPSFFDIIEGSECLTVPYRVKRRKKKKTLGRAAYLDLRDIYLGSQVFEFLLFRRERKVIATRNLNISLEDLPEDTFFMTNTSEDLPVDSLESSKILEDTYLVGEYFDSFYQSLDYSFEAGCGYLNWMSIYSPGSVLTSDLGLSRSSGSHVVTCPKYKKNDKFLKQFWGGIYCSLFLQLGNSFSSRGPQKIINSAPSFFFTSKRSTECIKKYFTTSLSNDLGSKCFLAISSDLYSGMGVLFPVSPWHFREDHLEYFESDSLVLEPVLPFSHTVLTLGQGFCASYWYCFFNRLSEVYEEVNHLYLKKRNSISSVSDIHLEKTQSSIIKEAQDLDVLNQVYRYRFMEWCRGRDLQSYLSTHLLHEVTSPLTFGTSFSSVRPTEDPFFSHGVLDPVSCWGYSYSYQDRAQKAVSLQSFLFGDQLDWLQYLAAEGHRWNLSNQWSSSCQSSSLLTIGSFYISWVFQVYTSELLDWWMHFFCAVYHRELNWFIQGWRFRSLGSASSLVLHFKSSNFLRDVRNSLETIYAFNTSFKEQSEGATFLKKFWSLGWYNLSPRVYDVDFFSHRYHLIASRFNSPTFLAKWEQIRHQKLHANFYLESEDTAFSGSLESRDNLDFFSDKSIWSTLWVSSEKDTSTFAYHYHKHSLQMLENSWRQKHESGLTVRNSYILGTHIIPSFFQWSLSISRSFLFDLRYSFQYVFRHRLQLSRRLLYRVLRSFEARCNHWVYEWVKHHECHYYIQQFQKTFDTAKRSILEHQQESATEFKVFLKKHLIASQFQLMWWWSGLLFLREKLGRYDIWFHHPYMRPKGFWSKQYWRRFLWSRQETMWENISSGEFQNTQGSVLDSDTWWERYLKSLWLIHTLLSKEDKRESVSSRKRLSVENTSPLLLSGRQSLSSQLVSCYRALVICYFSTFWAAQRSIFGLYYERYLTAQTFFDFLWRNCLSRVSSSLSQESFDTYSPGFLERWLAKEVVGFQSAVIRNYTGSPILQKTNRHLWVVKVFSHSKGFFKSLFLHLFLRNCG